MPVFLEPNATGGSGGLVSCSSVECLSTMNPTPGSDYEYSASLDHPVIGMEAEFELLVDGKVVTPESLWKYPGDFIEHDLLRRSSKSVQLPTGGALYFDSGVLEVVTPVIEIANRCTTRMVRSLWEQLEYTERQLSTWGAKHRLDVRLRGYSSHYNVSFEVPRGERNSERTVQKLATLLAHILLVPLIVTGTNRRSTGVGVRPRRDRVEMTLDFTPDPSLMLATAALVVGVARDVITWPTYMLTLLDELPIPTLTAVTPGKHTTRKGWLTKDYNFPLSPFTSSIDDEVWETRKGEKKSLRRIAFETAWFFRDSIRRHSDPFSTRTLFDVLTGAGASLLDLRDRPSAYDDLGRAVRWGTPLEELRQSAEVRTDRSEDFMRHLQSRAEVRARFEVLGDAALEEADKKFPEEDLESPRRRAGDLDPVLPPWSSELDRRRAAAPLLRERRSTDRRRAFRSKPADISRSHYEEIFVKVAQKTPLQIEGETFRPVAIRGWYHVTFERARDRQERTISIDRLASGIGEWIESRGNDSAHEAQQPERRV